MAEQRSPTSYELPDGESVFSAIERWLNQWLEDIEEAFERWMSDRESPVNSLSRLDSLLGAPVRILMIESRTNGHSKLADAVELAFGKLRYAAEKLDRFAVEDGPFFYSGDVNRGTDWIFGGDGEALGFSPLGEQGLMKSVESFGAAVYEIQLSTTANKLPISGSVAATDRNDGFNESPQSIKPRWDNETRKLTFAGRLVKQFSRQIAQNQTRILAEFEEHGWPEAIDDPLPGGSADPARRLADAVKGLNNNQGGLAFHLNPNGFICWEGSTKPPLSLH